MTFDPVSDWTDKATRSLRCGISVAGVVLIPLVFGGAPASAAPLEEAAGTVKSVTGTPAPQLPTPPPPPATPPAPVGRPTAPQIPVDQTPTGVTPASSPSPDLAPNPSGNPTKVPSPDADLPSIDGGASSTKESAGRVTSTSTEATQRGAPSVQGAAPVGSDPGQGPDSSRGRRSVVSVEAAPLPRWIAYVWPAIALGQTGDALAALLVRWEAATSLAASDAARLFSRLMGITRAFRLPASSDAFKPSEQPATPKGSLAAPPIDPVPAGAGMSLFLTMITLLMALLGLIALARLTVGEEFFSFLRWPH